MASGDGLLVRVRAGTRALTSVQLRALAELSTEHGHGHIELTRRANLQLRGVHEARVEALREALIALDLVAARADAERQLSWLVADPVAGLEARHGPLLETTRALECLLERELFPASLPAKLAIAVDGGSLPPDLRADLRIFLGEALEEDVRIELPTRSSLTLEARVAHAAVPGVVRALLDAFARYANGGARRVAALNDVSHGLLRAAAGVAFHPALLLRDPERHASSTAPGLHDRAGRYLALTLPFGAAEASLWRALAAFSDEYGNGTLRTTAARSLLMPLDDAASARKALTAARALGLAMTGDDPLLRVAACVGAPACRAARGDTRVLARELAAACAPLTEHGVSLHVSGCEKGCAHSGAAALTLVYADAGHVHVAAHADARAALAAPVVSTDAMRSRVAELLAERTARSHMPAPYDYERDGAEIYRRSFAIIRSEARLARFSAIEERIAVRLIHTSGMVDLADDIVFTPTFAEVARRAIQGGAPILCDAKMIVSGVTRARLQANNEVLCFLDHAEVPALARAQQTTRSAAALSLWRERLDGAVVVIGNAPTALFRLLELLDEHAARPSAVIGVPVGFVGAAESKEALLQDGRMPALIVRGRRGGSAMAVAAINALAQDEE